jgi:folylpolyglutamate synthase/dihydropteroate synthase
VADAARALGLAVHVEPSVVDALALARGLVNARGLVVVTGSLYTVGTARGEILAGAVRWEDAGR